MKQFYKLFFVILVFVAPVAGGAQTKGQPDSGHSSSDSIITVCDSIVWYGVTYKQTGDYRFLDSISNDSCTLKLTVCHSVDTTVYVTACNEYYWNGINYQVSDVYTQKFKTVHGCDCDSVVKLDLTIRPLPEVTIATTANTVCESGVIWVSNVDSTYLYQWSDSTTNTWMSVDTSGTYYVTATDTTNNCSKLDSITIVVNRPDTVNRVESICPGDSLEFYGQFLKTPGVYSYNEACDSVITLMLIVNPLPNVTIGGESSFCQGDDVTLTAYGASSYIWGNGNMNSSITVNTDSEGVFTYTVTGTDTTTGCVSVDTMVVTVNPTYNTSDTARICFGEKYIFFGDTLTEAGPHSHTLFSSKGCDSIITLTLTVDSLPNVTIDGESSFCQGDSVKLTASGASTYAWSNGTEDSVTTVNTAGTYYVTGTDNGCSFRAEKIVTVDTLPVITISGEDHFCPDSSTTLTASGADTYVWNTEDTTNSITVMVGDSLYSVTGTNSNSCKGTASKMTYFNPPPTPFIFGDSTICYGEVATLTAAGGETYQWSTEDEGNSIVVAMGGLYTVTATNMFGCSSTAEFTVSIAASPLVKKDIVGKSHADGSHYMLIYPEAGLQYQWYKNSDTIEGATKQYYYPSDYTLEGSLDMDACYQVEVRPNDPDRCGIITDCWEKPESVAEKVRILPNPNDGQFRLQLPDDAVSVQILNANGQVVLTRKTDGDELLEMNTGLANGIYFVKTFLQDGSFNTEKLIINR